MEKIRVLLLWCIFVCGVVRGTTIIKGAAYGLQTCTRPHVCFQARRIPRLRHFRMSGLLAGGFLSLPLCCSQQCSCPPAGFSPTSSPHPDFKHVVLGPKLMALPLVCSHRKQISPDLEMSD